MHLLIMQSSKKLKILFIHNNYYLPSGEEHSADAIAALLQENGHKVYWYRRSSTELDKMFMGKIRAIWLSIYNPGAVKDIKKIIKDIKPDIVQIQNLYPLISPRVLKTIKAMGIPVVMRCPNYRLFCPTGLFFDNNNEICEKCTGRGGELWCILKNCTGSRSKSIGYAIRNYVARITGVFIKYVDVFIVQSDFQRSKFVEHGISENRIEILPGITPEVKASKVHTSDGCITYVGRISPEKGIDDFLSAASLLPDLKFSIAGEVTKRLKFKNSPTNVVWHGFLESTKLDELFEESAVLVVPSRCYEGFPNVITRAMNHSKPVITTDIGCFPDIIDHGVNGFLYPSGNIHKLVEHIRWIVRNPDEASRMGQNGREKAARRYSLEVIYERLIEIYSKTLGK